MLVAGLVLLMAILSMAQDSAPVKVTGEVAFPGKAAERKTAPPAAQLKRIFDEALAAHQAGDIETAVARYKEFLRLKPDFVAAWSNLGAVLVKAGRFAEAVPNYEKALALAPRNVPVRLNLALAHYKQAQYAEAVPELERVHGEQPENMQAVYLLADCYLRLGENGKVVGLLDPLEAKNPDDRTVSYLLGTALLRDGQTERGREIIERFMRYGDTAEIHMLIGASQLAAMDYEAALLTLKKAVELNPELPGVWSLYGQAEMENDHPGEAKKAFRRELAADPHDFDANVRLGALLRMENQLDEALPFIREALRLRPDSISARYQIASIYLAKGEPGKAVARLESVVRDAPEFLEGHVQLASAYYKVGRKEDGKRERALIMKLNAENRKRERERQAVQK